MSTEFEKPVETLADRLALAFYEGYHGSKPADYDEYGSLTLHHRYLMAAHNAIKILREEGLLVEGTDSSPE